MRLTKLEARTIRLRLVEINDAVVYSEASTR